MCEGRCGLRSMKGKRTLLRILIIICALVLLLTAALIWVLPAFSMTGHRQTLEEAFAWQSDHYDTSFYGKLEKTAYTVNAEDGYVLHAELLKNPVETTDYVIISHGYTDNRMGALKYVPEYLDLGYNCIIYDLRGHGENEETFTTYGIREGSDLDCMIRDSRERYGDMTTLGIHGESLGAATTLTCLKYKPDVDFAVSDCGFSDIEGVLRHMYESNHMPGLLVDLADIGSRIRYHYAIKDMRPIDSLADNTVPVLFIHGAEDDFILPSNSEAMADATRGRSELCLIPGAGHAESVLKEPEMYEEALREFLGKLTKGGQS